MTQVRAEALLVLVTLLWSATFVLVKDSLTEISPAAFVFWRFSLATVVGVVLWGRSMRAMDRTLAVRGLVIGVLFGSGFILQSIGLTDTTPTSSAFITGTTVVFVPFIYRLVEHRTVSLLNWITTLVVLAGMFLFTEPENVGFRIGDALTVCSAMMWAAYIVAIDMYTVEYADNREKLNVLVLMQFVISACLALLVVPVADSAFLPSISSTHVLIAIAYCGIAATVVTTSVQTHMQRFTHPVRAGIIYSLEPIFASVIALMFYNEQWGWRQGAGACVMLSAVLVPDLLTLARKTT